MNVKCSLRLLCNIPDLLQLITWWHTGDWKRMAEFDKVLIMRVLRPDRLTAAMTRFVAGVLGPDFIASQAFDLDRSFQVKTLRGIPEH